jgi:hypothetical protein
MGGTAFERAEAPEASHASDVNAFFKTEAAKWSVPQRDLTLG